MALPADARAIRSRSRISGSRTRPTPTPSTITSSPNSSSRGTKAAYLPYSHTGTADSKRALAVQGAGHRLPPQHGGVLPQRSPPACPNGGLQVVMFTHQDASVWADLTLILWAAGLRVTAAWTVAYRDRVGTQGRQLRPGHGAHGAAQADLRRDRLPRRSAPRGGERGRTAARLHAGRSTTGRSPTSPTPTTSSPPTPPPCAC